MKIILQIIFQIICNYYIILCSGVKSNSNSNINSKFPKEVSFEFVSCNTKNFETMSDKWDDLFDDKYFK